MSSSWILSGARTPIGKFLGEFASVPGTELGGVAIAGALQKLSLASTDIDEVIMGQVLAAGAGQAPARQASRAAGIPDSVGCATVNKVCGSGLYAAMLADRAIRSGDCSLVVAGGMESMSHAPHLLRNARSGWKYGSQAMVDAIENDGLRCAHGQVMMGAYADKVATEWAIDRGSQDEWALESHRRALAAQNEKAFDTELVPVTVSATQQVIQDGGPRSDTSLERLSRLKPAFSPDGTVTAGNSSTLSDGAAAVVIGNEQWKERLQLPVAFRIVGTQVHAASPKDLFVAPVGAIQRLLAKVRKSIDDVDLFEINEAFAAQTIACVRSLRIPPEKVNVHGGALALGHPIGCSGSRVLVTLIHALLHRQKSIGVAALCLGGGEAVAMMVEAETRSS